MKVSEDFKLILYLNLYEHPWMHKNFLCGTFGVQKVYYFCQNTSGWPSAILNNHNWFKRTNIYKLSGLFATFSTFSDFIWPFLTSMTGNCISMINETPFLAFSLNGLERTLGLT